MTPKHYNAKNEELPWRNENLFKRLYNDKGMTMKEMADEWNCSPHTISVWADKNNIDTSQELNRKTAQWFVKKYKSGLSAYEIEKESSISARRIYSILKENDVDIRHPRDRIKEKEIVKKYAEGFSYRDIKKEFNINDGLIKNILEDSNIRIRDKTEHISVSGEEHPAWKEGTVDWYGSDWQTYRQKALKRDGFECVECGMSTREHQEKWNQELEVHHIVPICDFERVSEAHNLKNLKTVCIKCHRMLEWSEK